MLKAVIGLFLVTCACFTGAAALRAQPIRFACNYLSTEQGYSCAMASQSSSTFVLTNRLAPNSARINIYGWKANFRLFVEETVDKEINLIGTIDCETIIIASKNSSVRQCVSTK